MADVFLLDTLRLSEQHRGIEIRPGGSAANTAVWLAVQGVDVWFSGCVGDDWIGRALCSALDGAGVRLLVRTVPGEPTGSVLVELGSQGERTMRSSRGANTSLSRRDVTKLGAISLDFLHITGYSLLGDAGLDLLHAAGSIAKRNRAKLSFDPSSVGVINLLGRDTLLSALRAVGVDLLLPNREEAYALAGVNSPEGAAHVLANYIPTLAIKLGPVGCLAVADALNSMVPTTQLEAKDTTGAGDGFNAGVLAGLHAGLNLVDACQSGNGIASRVLLQYGAWPRHAS